MSWTPEKRAEASARSRARFADAATRAAMGLKQKERWAKRKLKLHFEVLDGAYPMEPDAASILANHRFHDGFELNTRRDWSDQDDARVAILAAAESNINDCASALGRSATSIAWRARDAGLVLPSDWKGLIKKPGKGREPRILLCYPYIKEARPEHSDLLRANAMVPRGMSNEMRADVCQSMMLALYEGTVTLEEIEFNRASVKWFIQKFRKEQQPWQEVQQRDYGDADDERPYHDAAVNRSEEIYLRADYPTWERPTQIKHVFDKQVAAASRLLPAKERQVVGLLQDGYNLRDIAMRLNITESQVLRRAHRAKEFVWERDLIDMAADGSMWTMS